MAVHSAVIVTDDGVFFYGNTGNPPRVNGHLLTELPEDWEPSKEHRDCFSLNVHLVDRRNNHTDADYDKGYPRLFAGLGLSSGLQSSEAGLRKAWENLDCAAGQIQVELEKRDPANKDWIVSEKLDGWRPRLPLDLPSPAYCGHQLTRLADDGVVCCLPCEDTYSQCSMCKLWFPEYDPKSIGEKPDKCDNCGHDKLFLGESGYRCGQCGHDAPVQKRAKCLDGLDEDGVLSHVSGKPAPKPNCIFCEMPDITGAASEETNKHATRGIAL